jgi:N-methylhydantoinase A
MADQVIELSTKRGHDIRDFSLIVGGGAGAVHGAHIAELLGISSVIIPRYAALYSAFGMFAMEIGREYSQSFLVPAEKLDPKRIESIFGALAEKATADFRESGLAAAPVVATRTAQMRYVGQFHEIEVTLPDALRSAEDLASVLQTFHARHKELYNFDLPQRGIEFRTLSLRATAGPSRLGVTPLTRADADPSAAFKRICSCLFSERWIETPCYDGARLLAGHAICGPAIIEELATSIVVPETFVCRVDASGSYVLARR